MKPRIVTIVRNSIGDWEGLYINRKLVIESHVLDSEEILEKLGIKCKFVYDYDMGDECGLPKNASELHSK